MCDELVSVGSTTSHHLRSLKLKSVMEITMTNELIHMELEVLRDEEFIAHANQAKNSDLDDRCAFQAIGDVLKQMSFTFQSQSN